LTESIFLARSVIRMDSLSTKLNDLLGTLQQMPMLNPLEKQLVNRLESLFSRSMNADFNLIKNENELFFLNKLANLVYTSDMNSSNTYFSKKSMEEIRTGFRESTFNQQI